MKSFMVKRNLHHTFPVQSPHTMDAILFRDVNKRNCGYCPLRRRLYRTIDIGQDQVENRESQRSRTVLGSKSRVKLNISLVKTLIADRPTVYMSVTPLATSGIIFSTSSGTDGYLILKLHHT